MAGFVCLACACGGATTAPSGTPPAPVNNAPPVIQSIVASSPRVEAGGQLQLTAKVTDAETPLDLLTYAWSASPQAGTFTGAGASVTWQAPTGQPTPAAYTMTLTVTETYTSGGQAKTNVVSSSVVVHYDDSVVEVGGLVVQFLTDFATFSVSPAECVRNFSDNCPGKAAELSDVQADRQLFHILDAQLGTPQVSLNADDTFADVDITCVFEDIRDSTGQKERVPGICTLDAVYENFRWLLCDSHFTSTGPASPEDLQFRVPGQLCECRSQRSRARRTTTSPSLAPG